MGKPRPKHLEFEATLDEHGAIAAGADAITLGPDWEAESLVLAGLLRCSFTSLRYHARRAGIHDIGGRGHANGVVTKRDSDGRYAFVEIEATLDVELDPPPEPRTVADLLAKAERDCFVGASLTAPPTYRWRVNGNDV